jgi:hypothetical protein
MWNDEYTLFFYLHIFFLLSVVKSASAGSGGHKPPPPIHPTSFPSAPHPPLRHRYILSHRPSPAQVHDGALSGTPRGARGGLHAAELPAPDLALSPPHATQPQAVAADWGGGGRLAAQLAVRSSAGSWNRGASSRPRANGGPGAARNGVFLFHFSHHSTEEIIDARGIFVSLHERIVSDSRKIVKYGVSWFFRKNSCSPNFEEAANWVPNVERLLYWVPNFQICHRVGARVASTAC